MSASSQTQTLFVQNSKFINNKFEVSEGETDRTWSWDKVEAVRAERGREKDRKWYLFIQSEIGSSST